MHYQFTYILTMLWFDVWICFVFCDQTVLFLHGAQFQLQEVSFYHRDFPSWLNWHQIKPVWWCVNQFYVALTWSTAGRYERTEWDKHYKQVKNKKNVSMIAGHTWSSAVRWSHAAPWAQLAATHQHMTEWQVGALSPTAALLMVVVVMSGGEGTEGASDDLAAAGRCWGTEQAVPGAPSPLDVDRDGLLTQR